MANGGDDGIILVIDNVTANGKPINMNQILSGVGYKYGKCDSGQNTMFTIWCDSIYGADPVLTFNIRAESISGEKVLWESTKTIS